LSGGAFGGVGGVRGGNNCQRAGAAVGKNDRGWRIWRSGHNLPFAPAKLRVLSRRKTKGFWKEKLLPADNGADARRSGTLQQEGTEGTEKKLRAATVEPEDLNRGSQGWQRWGILLTAESAEGAERQSKELNRGFHAGFTDGRMHGQKGLSTQRRQDASARAGMARNGGVDGGAAPPHTGFQHAVRVRYRLFVDKKVGCHAVVSPGVRRA